MAHIWTTKNYPLVALTTSNKGYKSHIATLLDIPRYLSICLFAYLSICPLAWSEATLLTPHNLSYQAKVKGMKLEIKHILKQAGDHYELTQDSSASLSSVSEKSIFTINPDGELLSQQYTYRRKILGNNYNYQLDFLPEKEIITHTIKGKITAKIDIPEVTYDPLNYQLQLRRDLLKAKNNSKTHTYPVAEKDRLKELKFKSAGSEILQTAVGAIDTLKIERIRSSKKNKTTTFWLAKDWGYILIKIQHQKNGKESYALNIVGGQVNGEKLQGIVDMVETASTQKK